MNTEEFIKKAKEVHGDKYDYSKVEYINAKTKVCIICPIHGEFLQIPKHHLKGCGCPSCNNSHLEKNIKLFLENNNINFEQQKRFKWLGKQSLDFYLPKYNIVIECQGIQHFKEIDFFGGIKSYEYTIKNDINKKDLSDILIIKIKNFEDIKKYCKENNKTLAEFVYENEDSNFKEFLKDVWNTMRNCVLDGLKQEGNIPGKLDIPRKAKKIYENSYAGMKVYLF